MPAYFTNRAFAHLKLENYGYAIQDAEAALELDQTFIKAYYRRASALMALTRFKEALRDLKTVCRYAPQDPDARTKLKQVEAMVRQEEFAKALAWDHDKKRVSETIRVSEMAVDASYDGPRWEDDQAEITEEFVMQMISMFERQGSIHRKYAYKILLAVKQLFDAMPPVIDVSLPKSAEGRLTICGDVHGQYYDLLNIFRRNGFPSATHAYLFNGDFVDRGSFSAEVILTLLAFKVLYPQSFFMARGNHETDGMNKVYGFEGEIRAKYSANMFQVFSEVFESMPLVHIVEKRVFITHGGLFSRDDVTVDELRKIDRFKQPPNEGLMCELLWSDPMMMPGRMPSRRGVGVQFGPDVTKRFLELNQLDMVIRSHEVKEDGYDMEHDGKCITIFSAPNYCDNMCNRGAYINVTRKEKHAISEEKPELQYEYVQFEAVPHPNVRAMAYAAMGGMF